MRSLKDFNSNVDICDLIPGEYYILEFPERNVNCRYYLFQFDSILNYSVIRRGNYISGRGTWEYSDDDTGHFFNYQNTSEVYNIRRYKGDVNWGTITYNDIR